MKAYAIVVRGNAISEKGFENLITSSEKVGNEFEIKRFEAIVPDQVDDMMEQYGLRWNYPWVGRQVDFASGLTKQAYKTRNPKSRIACALSHYLLWRLASKEKSPTLILEHDAKFIMKMDFDPSSSNMFIVGLNNPLGATRKSRDFYNAIVQNEDRVQPCPWVESNRQEVPQGLAGNSAYTMKPPGAQHMLRLVKDYGLWPNDALMCRQLVPRLGVTKKFYTAVQGLGSTTS